MGFEWDLCRSGASGEDKQERISNSNMKRSFVSAQNKCFSFTKSTWEKNIFIFFKLGRKQAAPFFFLQISQINLQGRPTSTWEFGIRSMEQIHPLLKHCIGGPTINDEDTSSI